jgi:2-keto-4-pentenoate hydratase/2-oxohepta-3-ene-1,7-dioic acid hydratase in catechol pathway
MRLATIEIDGRPEGAVIEADGSARPIGGTLQHLIEGGPSALEALRARMAEPAGAAAIPAAAVRLLAPLPRPEKNVFCVGRNYRDHIAEGERAQNVKIAVTEVPVYFTKPRTAVVGPGAEVPIFPHVSTQIDFAGRFRLMPVPQSFP